MQPQENNSIFGALVDNVDSFVSTARQEIDSPDVGDKMVWFVEGEDDETFYEQFFQPENVKFYYPKGCEKVRQIIAELDNLYPFKLYAIVDSDFYALNGIEENKDNIFRTDWHDHEMWLIYKLESLEKIYSDFKVPDYLHDNILSDAIDGIRNLSYIKWYHDIVKRSTDNSDYDNHNGLNFGKSGMNEHFGKTVKESLDYLYSIPKNTEGKIQINTDEVKEFINSNPNVDPRNLNVGHDLMNALSHVIRKHRPQNINRKDFYNRFKGYYSLEDFKYTGTYGKISTYFSTNGIPSPLL